MPIFGDYETIGEPVAITEQTGHVSTVWRARKRGSDTDPTHAIKCFAPHRRKMREGEVEEALDQDRGLEFLEGVKQLKKAHTDGGRYLSPIHAFGFADEGAWFVTDFYPRNTLKAWIARRGSVDGAALRQVVHCIVTGCLALKRSRGYSHGNLKAANVFLVGKPRPLRKTSLELADAYPAAPLQLARLVGEEKRTVDDLLFQVMEVQDLRALGELLLQLVEGRLVSSAYDYNYPIAAAPAWERLGRDAERWRELTNQLLDPRLSLEKINLESLAKEHRPGAVTEKLPLILGAAAGVVLLGAVIYWAAGLIGKAGNKKFEAHFQTATNAFAAGNWPLAQREIEMALDRRATDPTALEWRTKINNRLDQEYAAALLSGREVLKVNLDEAAKWVKRATELKPSGQDALDLQAQIGALFKQREMEKSRQTQVQQQAAEEFRRAMAAAAALERSGNFTNALAGYQAAQKLNANDPQVVAKIRELTPKATAQQGLAEEQARARQRLQEEQVRTQQQAAEELRRAMDAAAALERAGNFTNALSAYQAAQKLNANDPQVVAKIRELTPKATAQQGLVEEQAKMRAKAAAELQKAMAAAAALERAGDYTNALAAYQAAQKLDANDSQVQAKILELKPKAEAQQQQAEAKIRTQQQAAAEFRKAMDAAAALERSGNFTNALAAYQTAQKLNADDPQVLAKIREVTPKATAQQQQAAEQVRLQQQAAAEFRKAMDVAAALEQAGNFTNALAAYQAAQKLNAGDAQVTKKIQELTPKAAEQQRQVAEQVRAQNYQTALAAADKALQEAKAVTNYALVSEKIKAGLTQCAIALTNGAAGPVNQLARELESLQAKAEKEKADSDYASAETLKQAGKIQDALTVCQGYSGNSKFDGLRKTLTEMQNAYNSAITSLARGDYAFVKTFTSTGYDKNPLFETLMRTGTGENSQLAAMEKLRDARQWKELSSGLDLLKSQFPDVWKKDSFQALVKWVGENDPTKRLDVEILTLKILLGVDRKTVLNDDAGKRITRLPTTADVGTYYDVADDIIKRLGGENSAAYKARKKDFDDIRSAINNWR